MDRRVLAVGALVLVVFLSGCTVFGGGSDIDDEDLLQDADYEWNTTVNASITLDPAPLLSLSSDRYRAVIDIDGEETLDVHRERTFRGDDSLSIEALQFRFANGTIVNATHDGLGAVEESDYTEIQLPGATGQVAFTAEWGGSRWGDYGRSFRMPTYADGSYEVVLPEGARTGIPLLSRVAPSADERTVDDNQMTLYWEEPDSSRLSVRYYLLRDVYIVGTLVAIGGLVGIAGSIYYYRQIQRAKKVREEIGLDVEEELEDEDFGDDGPPPGMR